MHLGRLLRLGVVSPGFWAFHRSGLLISGPFSPGQIRPPPSCPSPVGGARELCVRSPLRRGRSPYTPSLTPQDPLTESEVRSPGLWWGFPVGWGCSDGHPASGWRPCFPDARVLLALAAMGPLPGAPGPGETDRESDREAESEEGRGEGNEEGDSTGSRGSSGLPR